MSDGEGDRQPVKRSGKRVGHDGSQVKFVFVHIFSLLVSRSAKR